MLGMAWYGIALDGSTSPDTIALDEYDVLHVKRKSNQTKPKNSNQDFANFRSEQSGHTEQGCRKCRKEGRNNR